MLSILFSFTCVFSKPVLTYNKTLSHSGRLRHKDVIRRQLESSRVSCFKIQKKSTSTTVHNFVIGMSLQKFHSSCYQQSVNMSTFTAGFVGKSSIQKELLQATIVFVVCHQLFHQALDMKVPDQDILRIKQSSNVIKKNF